MTATSSRIILGLRWEDDAPEVRVRDDGSAVSAFIPLEGLTLNYRAEPDSRRACLGRTPFRHADPDVVDCQNEPEPGSKLCTSCSIADATLASNLHHAHTRDRSTIDPEVAERLRQPNLLYLAGFRDGSIKVGTTTAKRGEKRLVEQGAWLARFVAAADDGYAVRDIEDRVTTDLGVPQSVSIGRKLEGMVTPLVEERLSAELDTRVAEVSALVKTLADDRLSPTNRDWRFADADAADWSGLHRYPLRLDSGQHDLECLAACGRMVSLLRPSTGDRFVADFGQLFGVELVLGDFDSDELAVQDALF